MCDSVNICVRYNLYSFSFLSLQIAALFRESVLVCYVRDVPSFSLYTKDTNTSLGSCLM